MNRLALLMTMKFLFEVDMKERWFPRLAKSYEITRTAKISTRQTMLGALIAAKVMIEALPGHYQDAKIHNRIVDAIAKGRRLR